MITVNGKPIQCTTPITLTELIQNQGLNPERIALELNGEIIKRSEFDTTFASDGDKVEMVHFVGGG